MTSQPPGFNEEFQARLHDLFLWRRDVRRFRTEPLPSGLLEQLIAQACLAPSVGLSQPWRFVLVDDPERRQAIIDNFSACNRDALDSYAGAQAAAYARLKLAGLTEAPCHLAIFADQATSVGHGLGLRTMPEMLSYSVVAAICNLWLAARAHGVGVGWISILDPDQVRGSLELPATWKLIGYFCVGYPEHDDETPELERENWERRRAVESFITRR